MGLPNSEAAALTNLLFQVRMIGSLNSSLSSLNSSHSMTLDLLAYDESILQWFRIHQPAPRKLKSFLF